MADLTPGFSLNRLAPSNRGSYWVGQDGNVWVAGSNGTNNAGRFDNNSHAYWQGKGFNLTQDPNPGSGGGGAKRKTGANGENTDNNTNNTVSTPSASDIQIEQINRLLGSLDSKSKYGVKEIDDSYGQQKNYLNEDRGRTMQGYDRQVQQNDKNKQRGVEQVDAFANQSYNNLQRLLQGANAGNSSVGRMLVPQLVSKAAGTRRQGVFDTAGENAENIDYARKDAESQYTRAFDEAENTYRRSKRDYLTGIEETRNDLLAKRLAMEADAGMATDATRAELDRRTASLDSLFKQYMPKYDKTAFNFKTPELGQYQLDPASLRYDQSLPQDQRAYLPALKRKQQLEQGV